MNRLFVLFQFYKTFIVWSVVITSFMIWLNSDYIPSILTKLFLILFAWYFMTETANKKQFTFYKNLGISPIVLFSFVFFIDSILTLILLFLFKAPK